MSSELEQPPITGDAALDEALTKVAGLGELGLEDHPEILRAAQEALQDLLNPRPVAPSGSSAA